MTAQVIQFPVKQKIETKTKKFVEEDDFPPDWPYKIVGVNVFPPTTAKEYLELCKKFLEPEDYTDMLIGIMDEDAYAALEVRMRKLIDNYYDFVNRA